MPKITRRYFLSRCLSAAIFLGGAETSRASCLHDFVLVWGQTARAFFLPRADREALLAYTRGASSLNRFNRLTPEERAADPDFHLRENQEKLIRRSEAIERALERLHPYRGVCHRYDSLPRRIVDQFLVPGKIYADRAFFSASRKEEQSAFNAGEQRVHFVITSKTGRDIKRYSDLPREKEILFKRATRFLVKRVVSKPGTYSNFLEITLEEL